MSSDKHKSMTLRIDRTLLRGYEPSLVLSSAFGPEIK